MTLLDPIVRKEGPLQPCCFFRTAICLESVPKTQLVFCRIGTDRLAQKLRSLSVAWNISHDSFMLMWLLTAIAVRASLKNDLRDVSWNIEHKRCWFVIIITLWVFHAKCTHVQCIPINVILFKQPLKRFCIPYATRLRIFYDEVPSSFVLVLSNFYAEVDHRHCSFHLLVDMWTV